MNRSIAKSLTRWFICYDIVVRNRRVRDTQRHQLSMHLKLDACLDKCLAYGD